jgi:hypothetical protein
VNTHLQDALDLVIEGVLTQLPAQLITAAVVAATATWMRARKRSRARVVGTPAGSGTDDSPQAAQVDTDERSNLRADLDAAPNLGKR